MGPELCANVPTEEVFTTPHRLRVEGTVRGTRAVAYDEGIVLDGIELRFAAGEIVEAHASRRRGVPPEAHRQHPGANRLGEVALVAGSRIGQRDLLFYNTLYDENARSHIAYGMGYVEPVEGATASIATRRPSSGSTTRPSTRTSRSAARTSRSTGSTPTATGCRSCAATTGC